MLFHIKKLQVLKLFIFFAGFSLLLFIQGMGEAREIVRAEFTSTGIPVNAEGLKKPFTSSDIKLIYDDGSSKTIALKYHEILRSGDRVGNQSAGMVLDKIGNPITNWGITLYGDHIREGAIHLSAPDGNSLITFKNASTSVTDQIYLVTQFEHNSWVVNHNPDQHPFDSKLDTPGAINLTALFQNDQGLLTKKYLKNIDGNTVSGFWFPCAASITPWNTHLGSEEYEPDAQLFENVPFEPINLYMNTYGKTVKQGGANPYDYGFPIEIMINEKGLTRVNKRYVMGRISVEQGRVMPDGRTVYLADDAKDGVRLMFVADRKMDLSSGTLYAAKWVQRESGGGGKANLNWIKLGHAIEKTIRELILRKITFSDIFDSLPKGSFRDSQKQIDGFKPVYVFNGFSPKLDKPEKKSKSAYLKIKPGMETAAAFLETRRFAGLKGATTEFTKMEGQAFNRRDKKLYTVISKAYKGMVAGKNKERFQDDIKLTGDSDDLKCGVIYESDLKLGIKDTRGNSINSKWVAVNMNALLTNQISEGNLCDDNGIANPDGLEFSESLRTLFIGEDSDELHSSNFLWAYTPQNKALKRILIAPKDSEISGLHISEDINGSTYLFSNFQRDILPENFWKKMPPEKANKFVADRDLRGIVGYIGPINVR
ncbi:MAG: alkaline phosphatase PhoX [Nitrospinales bacterium]